SLSESISLSEPAGVSESISASDSVAVSEVPAPVVAPIVADTTSSVDASKLQALVDDSVNFVNTDEFKSADPIYQAAYSAVIAQYQSFLETGVYTQDDIDYGYEQLSALVNQIKSPVVAPHVFAATAVENDYTMINGSKWIDGDDKAWRSVNELYATRDTGQSYSMAQGNILVTKRDNGDGTTHWTIENYYKGGLYYASNNRVYGLENARLGFALTKDYTIVGDIAVTMKDFGSGYVWRNPDTGLEYRLERTVGNETTDIISTDNPNNQVTFSNGKTSTEQIQEAYYIKDDAKLLQTRIYGSGSYNTLEIQDLTSRTDTLDVNNNDSISSRFDVGNIGSGLFLKSWGTGRGTANVSYKIEFDTVHSNQVQKDLTVRDGTAFSGLYSVINSQQNRWRNLNAELVGEEVDRSIDISAIQNS
ncbi:TPA: hypothetical protein U1C30_002289, partial [Streptococcus suis]|nr:hypothetical protein [Streptococcus suis]